MKTQVCPHGWLHARERWIQPNTGIVTRLRVAEGHLAAARMAIDSASKPITIGMNYISVRQGHGCRWKRQECVERGRFLHTATTAAASRTHTHKKTHEPSLSIRVGRAPALYKRTSSPACYPCWTCQTHTCWSLQLSHDTMNACFTLPGDGCLKV